jgi:outer membrane receptor protein involved in Fe transport
LSPSLGVSWQANKAWRLRAAAEQGFRVPTLNELYRPFRQGNNITEANPDLKAEHVTSAELGADGNFGRFRVGMAGFGSALRDAVDAVTIASGPANVPGIGAIPAGGTGLERLNLDRVRVAGLRTYAEWWVSDSLRLRADLLCENTDILGASVNPALVGNRLVQVPDYTVVVGGAWSAPGGFEITPRLRWIGAQFSDDQNQLRQPAVAVADISISRRLGRHARIFAAIENLGGAQIVTDVNANGVVNVGEPRLASIGIRLE